jgi:hypothetical protein
VNSSKPPKYEAPRRLTDVLRALPGGELDGLVSRLRIRIDPLKRLDVPTQVARALVALPEIRDTTLLPPASAELLHRTAEAGGTLIAASVPSELQPLAARGIVFARLLEGGQVELILPIAYLVQLKSWEGEDPRGARPLLAQASFETCTAIATHYLGRPATPPLPLSLEAAWETLADPARMEEELERLSPQERRLLEAVEREGGEVLTEELLDLEREPMRLRSAMGATPSRRGAGFALERRGFLIPVHPNRHVIPTEVAAVVGKAANAERAERREQVRESVLAGDYLPRRARFAEDPAPLAMAMALAVREAAGEVRAQVGTPRSLTTRMSQRFGRDLDRVAMVSALSRAAGLWEPSALSPASPPGSWTLHALGHSLFRIWHQGGAWDEARAQPEVYRLPPDARDPSPVGLLREMLLDALRELGEGRWVPWNALAGYVRDDGRTAGVARLLRRWADRLGIEAPAPVDVVRRMAFESLPALGILDLGDPDATDDDGQGDVGPAMRLTPRGRQILHTRKVSPELTPSRFSEPETLSVGTSATVAQVLAIAAFADVGKVAEQIELVISNAALARALSAGIEAELVKTRLEALCSLPESLAKLLAQAGTVLARGRYVPAAGFLWIDDANVREMLRTRRQTADLFLELSPAEGLLMAPNTEIDRVIRRCRAVGVELTFEGRLLRARATTPPPEMPAPERRKTSSTSLKRGGG